MILKKTNTFLIILLFFGFLPLSKIEAGLGDLPDELLASVLSETIDKDVPRAYELRRVCRRWDYNLTQHSQMFVIPGVDLLPGGQVCKVRPWDDEKLNALEIRFPYLESISLNYFMMFSPQNLERFFTDRPIWRNVELNCSLSKGDRWEAILKGLKINLKRNKDILSYSLNLTIGGLSKAIVPVFLASEIYKSENLVLSLGLEITKEQLQPLVGNQNIEEFDFCGRTNLALEDVATFVNSLPNLKSLGFRFTIPKILQEFSKNKELCKRLGRLELSNTSEYPEDFLINFLQSCPNLKTLSIPGSNISGSALLTLLTICPLIQALDISQNPNLSSEFIAEFIRMAKNLRAIKIDGCNVTREQVGMLREQLEHIFIAWQSPLRRTVRRYPFEGTVWASVGGIYA
ncbi:TPA: hypothetical protein DEO28_02880 [Candidatus Dependentiae bacterium]|nr:MAG: hypothetical protein UR14_C0005G0073 [candidate division TM6 bacterium GW2011_GWE2_31_21]KKP53149.1 MAG: hypothetical protein UR43_C0007G0073 [candidate division TM6 bacterium GW2011_GWF2_33_332]HBS47968.1 hypothetical protein [Candidatus Dependentiae bacterium]HBZ73428.1 hypothetical protein [Candidatus Dependentiae bacterium]